MNKFLVLALVLVASYSCRAEDSAHDVIMKVNKQALEDDLEFGFGDQPPLIEGDIVDDAHTRAMMAEERRVADGQSSPFDALQRGKWPNGVVPYVFGSVRSSARKQIQRAIQEFKTKIGCVNFVPRSNQKDYVIFNQKGGCYSMIGRTGRGSQEISIGRGCESLGTVIHEMMHAIGFFHEQSRRDRDKYVQIYWNNISPSMKFNFNMYRSGEANTYNEPYDFKSVMHYSKYSFSTNRQPTIVSRRNPSEKLGNSGFSQTDIRQIKKHYGCLGGGPNPPAPATQPPTGGCRDISSRCAQYKHKCRSNNFVRERCHKTCGVCRR